MNGDIIVAEAKTYEQANTIVREMQDSDSAILRREGYRISEVSTELVEGIYRFILNSSERDPEYLLKSYVDAIRYANEELQIRSSRLIVQAQELETIDGVHLEYLVDKLMDLIY